MSAEASPTARWSFTCREETNFYTTILFPAQRLFKAIIQDTAGYNVINPEICVLKRDLLLKPQWSQTHNCLVEATLNGFVWEFIVRSIKRLKSTQTANKVHIPHKELCLCCFLTVFRPINAILASFSVLVSHLLRILPCNKFPYNRLLWVWKPCAETIKIKRLTDIWDFSLTRSKGDWRGELNKNY